MYDLGTIMASPFIYRAFIGRCSWHNLFSENSIKLIVWARFKVRSWEGVKFDLFESLKVESLKVWELECLTVCSCMCVFKHSDFQTFKFSSFETFKLSKLEEPARSSFPWFSPGLLSIHHPWNIYDGAFLSPFIKFVDAFSGETSLKNTRTTACV